MQQLVREWSSAATIIIWAVVAEDDAEAIRRGNSPLTVMTPPATCF
jgi:hypothetical protein